MSAYANDGRIEVLVGDITRLDNIEVIVNAANERLLGGGGVDGAIHDAAGPELLAHNETLGGCATGEAKLTPSFALEKIGVRAIIHTVGPVWGSDPLADGSEPLGYRAEDNQLARCYSNCLELCAEAGLRSIAFPAISTGVYGFPKERAATIAIGHARAHLGRSPVPARVLFCCYSQVDADIYLRLLRPKDLLKKIGAE